MAIRRQKFFFPLHITMADKKTFPFLSDIVRVSCGSAMVALILLVIAVFPVKAGDPSSSFTLEVHNSLVDLAAEDVPLREILKAISRQAGLTLRSADQVMEPVSCHLDAVPLAEGLEKLLANWNYALLYKKDSQGRSVPDTLWIMNRNPHRMTVNITSTQQRLTSIDSSATSRQGLRKFKKEDIPAVFSDSEKILIDFEAEPFVHDELGEGVEITSLSDTSPLKLIGLQEGDQIININGQPVSSAEELVRTLATPLEGNSAIIRIERYRDGFIDPIYLELQ